MTLATPSTTQQDALLSPQQVLQLLQDPASPPLALLDCTFFIPPDPRTLEDTFQANHLPGAQPFDVDQVADHSQPYPHMLPTPEAFAATMDAMAITRDHWVIVYDQHGLMTAPRGWWMFQYFGHPKVSVMAGGLPTWQKLGFPTESGAPTPKATPNFPYVASIQPQWLKSRQDVLTNLTHPAFQVVDARGGPRFRGEVPEPRPGLRSGHIPQSVNVPWDTWVNPETQSLYSAEAMQTRLTQAKVQWEAPLVFSCGSGVTACMGAFGCYLMGKTDVAVYDGSWAEWGSDPNLPIESK